MSGVIANLSTRAQNATIILSCLLIATLYLLFHTARGKMDWSDTRDRWEGITSAFFVGVVGGLVLGPVVLGLDPF